jgi:hypothetical protein
MRTRTRAGYWLAIGSLLAACGDGAPAPRKQSPVVFAGSPAIAPVAPSAGVGAVPSAVQAGSSGSATPPPARNNRPPAAGTGGRSGATPGGPLAGGAPGAPAAGGGAPAPPPGPPGTWPAADPAKTGPFATTTENNTGPDMMFTMFRPMMLTQRHPVITWGNGTGTTPQVYSSMLTLYASHGFIVIASNSENVAQGTPPPMLAGVTWVLEQDMNPMSPLYEKVDRDRVGATGHSQGAFAASSVASNAVIKTIAPIQSFGGGRGLHGPVLALCGAMDETVPCSGNLNAFNSVSNQPAMYAEQKMADHTNWIFSPGAPGPYYVITNAWFRVHLMNDMALRPMFYGPDCGVCKDTASWNIMRKMMDN